MLFLTAEVAKLVNMNTLAAMPVMAEVDIFTSTDSPNTSLHGEAQNGDRIDSCDLTLSLISENNNALVNEPKGRLVDESKNAETEGNREGSSYENAAYLPTQDGGASQMKQSHDTEAMEIDLVPSRDSLDIPVSLGNDKDSKEECSNAVNLTQTSNCSSENLQCGKHPALSCEKHVTVPETLSNTVQNATQGSSKQESGLPLPVITSLANSGTTSRYFTRSAKKVSLTDPGPCEALAAQSTTCSPVVSVTPTTSAHAMSLNSITTFAITSPQQNSEPAMTINSTPSALANSGMGFPYITRSATKKANLTSSVSHGASTLQSATHLLVTSGSPSTCDITNSSKPLTTFTISLPQNSEPAPIVSSSTTAQDAVQTLVISSTSIGLPASVRKPALSTIPARLPNVCLAVKQDDPVSVSSIPVRVVTSQSLAQALATCNFPKTVSSASTTAINYTPVIIQSSPVTHNPEKAQPTTCIPSSTVSMTASSLSLPVTSNSTVLATIPATMKSSKPVVPVKACSNDEKVTADHIVTPESLALSLATCNLPITVTSTSTTAVNCTPVMIPSVVYNPEKAQPTIGSTVVSGASSLLSLSTSNNPGALATLPVTIKSSKAEVPVKTTSSDETSAANVTPVSENPSVENAASLLASTVNSPSSLPEILAIFPDFSPCPKCNSILVCSCPGPSGIGDGTGVTPATCQAASQGDSTCDGMKVNQTDGVSPPCGEDVKPQIFPAVVSIGIMYPVHCILRQDTLHTSLSVFFPLGCKMLWVKFIIG